ncbi:hypothetical protein J6590_026169 [Homalodisca vitripennis]|nr:hypothetical protein J6590_026169 [Homalodisca vitripennis]
MSIKFYPIVEPIVGNTAAFVFFGISALVGTIFLALFLPETHGKTLQDIEDYFRGSKKSNKSSSEVTTP